MSEGVTDIRETGEVNGWSLQVSLTASWGVNSSSLGVLLAILRVLLDIFPGSAWPELWLFTELSQYYLLFCWVSLDHSCPSCSDLVLLQ